MPRTIVTLAVIASLLLSHTYAIPVGDADLKVSNVTVPSKTEVQPATVNNGTATASINGTAIIASYNTSSNIPANNTAVKIIPEHSTTTPAITTTSPANLPTTVSTTSTTAATTTTASTTTTPKPTLPTKSTEKPTSTISPTIQPSPTTEPIKPTPAPTVAPHGNDRKFDGPSFIGGIILACGLTAIGFIAFKFYKARTEHNYHTL